ncbi:hypothetical protein Hdeb2414_s0008g00282951 [Helianthus debilis subsp. tardiflorus]
METAINHQSVENLLQNYEYLPLLSLINSLCLIRGFKRELTSPYSSFLHHSTNLNHCYVLAPSAPEVVEKPGDNSLSRLKMLYVQAKELSETEVAVSSQLLSQLIALIPTGPLGQQRRRMEGNEQKKKRMKADLDVPRLSPSLCNHRDHLANLKGR